MRVNSRKKYMQKTWQGKILKTKKITILEDIYLHIHCLLKRYKEPKDKNSNEYDFWKYFTNKIGKSNSPFIVLKTPRLDSEDYWLTNKSKDYPDRIQSTQPGEWRKVGYFKLVTYGVNSFPTWRVILMQFLNELRPNHHPKELQLSHESFSFLKDYGLSLRRYDIVAPDKMANKIWTVDVYKKRNKPKTYSSLSIHPLLKPPTDFNEHINLDEYNILLHNQQCNLRTTVLKNAKKYFELGDYPKCVLLKELAQDMKAFPERYIKFRAKA